MFDKPEEYVLSIILCAVSIAILVGLRLVMRRRQSRLRTGCAGLATLPAGGAAATPALAFSISDFTSDTF